MQMNQMNISGKDTRYSMEEFDPVIEQTMLDESSFYWYMVNEGGYNEESEMSDIRNDIVLEDIPY